MRAQFVLRDFYKYHPSPGGQNRFAGSDFRQVQNSQIIKRVLCGKVTQERLWRQQHRHKM